MKKSMREYNSARNKGLTPLLTGLRHWKSRQRKSVAFYAARVYSPCPWASPLHSAAHKTHQYLASVRRLCPTIPRAARKFRGLRTKLTSVRKPKFSSLSTANSVLVCVPPSLIVENNSYEIRATGLTGAPGFTKYHR